MDSLGLFLCHTGLIYENKPVERVSVAISVRSSHVPGLVSNMVRVLPALLHSSAVVLLRGLLVRYNRRDDRQSLSQDRILI